MARKKVEPKPFEMPPVTKPSEIHQGIPWPKGDPRLSTTVKVRAEFVDLHHPFQKIWIRTMEPTDVVLDGWLKSQIDGGLIVEIK